MKYPVVQLREMVERLQESGLDKEQIPQAIRSLARGECLATWDVPHAPGRKYFGVLRARRPRPRVV